MKHLPRPESLQIPTASQHPRRGTIIVWSAIFLSSAMAFLAFSVDLGYIITTEAELQTAADMGALSGAKALKNGNNAAVAAATDWAGKNTAAGAAVTQIDAVVGTWDAQARTFTAGGGLRTRSV